MIVFSVVALQLRGETIKWSSYLILALFVGSAGSAVAFVVTEMWLSAEPMIPLGFLKMSSVAGSMLCGACLQDRHIIW